jgi:hypothetical protein
MANENIRLTVYQCHTHPKVKDGPKRRRETHTVRARAVSSASATSSSYPITKDPAPQDIVSTSHSQSRSTPTPSSAAAQQPQYVGIPSSLPTSAHPTTSFPIAQTPTPTSISMGMHLPLSSSSHPHSHAEVKQEPVVGMFSSPLQPMSTFSSAHSNPNAAHAVSEPELVGVKATSSYNSLAGMI